MDGYLFGSGLEAAVYRSLKEEEKGGRVKIEKTQDSVYLTDAKILYKPDFKMIDLITGLPYWVEAKGLELPSWRIKLRLWKHYGPGPLMIYKGSKTRIYLADTVVPITKPVR